MKNLILFVAVFSLAIILGCKGEKGDPGPTGPTGNANVKSSQFVVSPSQWVDSGPNSVYVTSQTNLITQSIATNGTVLAFFKLSNGGWASLPNGFGSSSGSISVNYLYGTGYIEILVGSATLTNTEMHMTATFKIVVMDAAASLAKIDRTNYEELKNAFHLEN